MVTKNISYKLASSDDELRQIIALQARNLTENITTETRRSQGFVTVKHTFELLKRMNESAGQVIAVDHDKVVAYALVMRPELRSAVPVLVPMFDMFDTIQYRGQSLTSYRYYVMGQVCVGEGYRGFGLFDGLYNKHREVYSKEYEVCITEISESNERSMRAHERVGFRTIHKFSDKTDDWNIVLWDWSN